MLNFLKNLNVWGALREARDTLANVQVALGDAQLVLHQLLTRLEDQRAYIGKLHDALDAIAALEPASSSDAVKMAVIIARGARQ